jgi:hypothetical protein
MSSASRVGAGSVLVSAADARYGKWLLNLVGSVQRRSDLFDAIVVYDLGLSRFQRRLLEGARGVQVREVPPFVPHWRGGRTWKTWIWTHTDAETIVWLDAGITVLRPLTDFLDGVARRGYFVVSTGVANGPSTPSDYYSLYGLTPDFANEIAVTAGILAFSRSSSFYSDVIEPSFQDAILGRNLGFSPHEVSRLNWGLDELEQVVVRDCEIFRHEQTVLNIHFYRSTPHPHVSDLFEYGGFRTPHDHPNQAIWNHRRRGDYRFLPRVRYQPLSALVGIPWGTAVCARHLTVQYRWLLRPSFHASVGRRLLAATGLRPRR